MQESKPAEKKITSWLTLIVKIVVSVELVRFFYTLNWVELANRLLHVNLFWFFTAVAIFGFVLFSTAIRFWLLLRVQGIFLPFGYSWSLGMIGNFFSLFLPGSVSGDFIKLFYLLKTTQTRKARAALVVGLDRILGLVVLLTIMAVIFPSQIHKFETTPWIKTTAWVLLALLFLASTFGLAIAFLPLRKLPYSIKRLWPLVPKHHFIESLYVGYLEHLRHPGLTFFAIFVSYLAHLGNFIIGYTLARSLSLDVSFFEMIIIMSMVMNITCLPISFGGHGIRELTFAIFFQLYGITSTLKDPSGPACGLLLLMVNIIWGLAGGIIFLTFRHQEKAETPDLP